MKVLITGANGLLGQKLIKIFTLYSPETNIVAISEGVDEIIIDANYEYFQLDITNHTAVKNIITDEQPNYIINCAAITNVDRCELQKNLAWNVNVEAVKNIVDIIKDSNIHLIQLSTDFIFDGRKGPYKETDKTKPSNFYGTTKLEAEKYIKASNAKYTIVRTIQVYGHLENLKRPNIVTWVLNSLKNNQPIQVFTDQYRTPTLAEDLALGCFLIIQKHVTGIYNISSDEYLSLYEMVLEIADYFKLNKELIRPVKTKSFVQIAKRPLKTGLIIDKAKQELGYSPKTFREGIDLIATQHSI